jgi:hypothetical protein
MIGERAVRMGGNLVVQVTGRRRLVEFAGWANGFLAWIGPRKPGRHIPVEVVDGVWIFSIGLG